MKNKPIVWWRDVNSVLKLGRSRWNLPFIDCQCSPYHFFAIICILHAFAPFKVHGWLYFVVQIRLFSCYPEKNSMILNKRIRHQENKKFDSTTGFTTAIYSLSSNCNYMYSLIMIRICLAHWILFYFSGKVAEVVILVSITVVRGVRGTERGGTGSSSEVGT